MVGRESSLEALVDRHIKTLYDWAHDAEDILKRSGASLGELTRTDASISSSVRYHAYFGFAELRALCSPAQLEVLERGEAQLLKVHKEVREAYLQRLEIARLDRKLDSKELAKLDALVMNYDELPASVEST